MFICRVDHEKVAHLPLCTCPCDISLALVCILRRVFEQLVNSRAVTMLRYTGCNIVILMAAPEWLMSCSSCILGTLAKYGIRIKSAQDTGTERQYQPRSCSHQNHCYIGYTSTWLDVHSCVLMQEATTFTIFYNGISFQHLATVLISVFALWYGPGLLFRGPPCINNRFHMRRLKLNSCQYRKRGD